MPHLKVTLYEIQEVSSPVEVTLWLIWPTRDEQKISTDGKTNFKKANSIVHNVNLIRWLISLHVGQCVFTLAWLCATCPRAMYKLSPFYSEDVTYPLEVVYGGGE